MFTRSFGRPPRSHSGPNAGRWAVFSSLLLLPALASAQTPSINEGYGVAGDQHATTGVKLSDELYFHPSVGIGAGYSTNVFYDSEDDPLEPEGSPLLRFGVGIQLATENQQGNASDAAISFFTDLDLTWNQYLSDVERVEDQSDLGVAAIMSFVVNPQGAVRLKLRDSFVRAIQPSTVSRVDDADRDRNEFSATLEWAPGGGALSTALTYAFLIDVFESETLELGNRFGHRVLIGGSWQWLPRTSFETQAEINFLDPNDVNEFTAASTAFTYWLGTTTLLTSDLGAVLRVGYANASYNDGPDLNTYTARAELRWAPHEKFKLGVGYNRSFLDSIIANFHADHEFYLKAVADLTDRVKLSTSGSVDFRTYEYPEEPGGYEQSNVRFCSDSTVIADPNPDPTRPSIPGCPESDREETLVSFDARLEYLVTDFLLTSLTYQYAQNITDAELRFSDGVVDHVSYRWQLVMLAVEARY